MAATLLSPALGTYAYRIRMERVSEPSPRVGGPADIRDLCRSLLEDEAQEVFIAILLNTQHRVIGYTEVSRGTVDASLVHPREVFRVAILQNAAALVVAHNHPSGIPTPSREDIAVTKSLWQAGRILGIRVLDSVIVGHGGAYESLADIMEDP